eukprot:Seg4503.3 transcript_id=Seg4503.3/GoldUCD/mRNA.D3Y31 product="5-hydroxytryptamine receptor 6" protein_id=Seg4503.3/GoldUCD/D3Y31
MANNTTLTKPPAPLVVYWEVWSIYIILGIFIIVGNALMIAIYITWKQLRTPTNTFLVMLATADLLIGVIFIPLYIGGHYLEYYHSISISENIDQVLLFTFFASVFNLYAVTADRYIAVLYALRYNALMTTRTVSMFVAAAWLCPALITAILLICKSVAADIQPMILFGFEIAFVIIPGFLMVFVYVMIFKEARKQICQVASLQVRDSNKEKDKAKKRRAEHKVAKTCALLLFIFMLCWIPTCIEQILNLAQVQISTTYSDVAIILMVCNSAVNPFLYGLIKQDFRNKLKVIFRTPGSRNFDRSGISNHSMASDNLSRRGATPVPGTSGDQKNTTF